MGKAFFLILTLTFAVFGQDNSAKISQVKQTLEQVTKKQAQHDAYIQKLVDHLKTQDLAIEKQVKAIVDLISKFKDSEDSRNKILRNKESVIKGLRKSIDYYNIERKKMNQELVYAKRYPSEDLQKIKDWLDKKIESRVKQIMQISKSLGSYQDSNKNRYSSNNSNNDRADDNREKLAKDMKKAKEELIKKIAKLERELDNVNTKIPMADIANELTALYKKIELIDESVMEVKYGKGTKAQKMGKKGAMNLDKDIREMVRDVKSEFQSFTRGLASTIRLLAARKDYNEQTNKLEATLKILQEK